MRFRDSLRTRYLLLLVLLIGAPSVALLPLLLNWLPARLQAARLKRSVDALSSRIALRNGEASALRARITIARNDISRLRLGEGGRWLPQRDARGVFDRCAAAVTGVPVTVRKLVLGEPRLYAGVSRDNLLAADRIEAICRGSYRDLTQCLDALAELAPPLRFSEVTWRRQGRAQQLRLVLDAPFVPDEPLATVIGEKSDLK